MRYALNDSILVVFYVYSTHALFKKFVFSIVFNIPFLIRKRLIITLNRIKQAQNVLFKYDIVICK